MFAIAVGGRAAESEPAPTVVRAFEAIEANAAALAETARAQKEASRAWTMVHDFEFADRRVASGIGFVQRPVEDGAKTYKAVHYDHGTGLAVADVDRDGWPDLYFVNQVGGNELWRGLGGGRFENVTASAGVALEGKVCVGASFGDVDNDGWPDLFVTTVRMGNVLFRNQGNGRFRDATAEAGLVSPKPTHASGAVFFDFDRDGRLDLFVANVGVYTRNEKGKDGFYLGRSDAFQGWMFPARSEASVLYRNVGGGKFVDVSKETGLEHRGWTGDATACDANRDGWPDLYVLDMSGNDRLYVNESGRRFVEKTAAYFPKTPWGSMGVKFFDHDLDGRLDLYVTDMHSDMTGAQIRAGDRDFGPAFEKAKSDPWCSVEWSAENLRRATNSILGNAFYRNRGTEPWEEASGVLGLETYWPWGPTVADFNADGYEDVFVTAGMGYPLRYVANSLLLNDGGRRFVEAAFVLGLEPRKEGGLETEFFVLDCSGEDARHPLCRGRTGKVTVLGTRSSRSAAAVDIDGDGDLDLVTNEWSGRPQVWVSDLNARGGVRHLGVRLEGTTSNRDGLGATVVVRAGETRQTRYHDGKSGYLSQSSLPMYFGLGKGPDVGSVEVVWPSGRRQTVTEGIPKNGLLTVTEPR
ncbi:MAG: CRTAC1 family protein [Verrucomicrobiales bacterium]|nr:CRTAC1 family protein [Verrucomicrobiales bacterium]